MTSNLFRAVAASTALFMACSLHAATPPAPVTNTAKTMTPQQQRMVSCNQQASGKTGADRKSFMSSCLKGQTPAPVAAAKPTRQQKMTACSADAKSKALKGTERKTFMSTCLKGSPATP